MSLKAMDAMFLSVMLQSSYDVDHKDTISTVADSTEKQLLSLEVMNLVWVHASYDIII